MMRKPYRILFLLLLIFPAIFGLSIKLSSSEAENKITVVLDWTPNAHHTGLYVAKELNYFSDENLNVEITQPPDGAATTLVASGKAQFGIDFQNFLAPSLAKDNPLPVKVVAAVLQHNSEGIISKKEKNISTLKDLERKNYLTWNNPMEIDMLSFLLKESKADFSKINLINSCVDNIPAALKSNVDAAWVYYGVEGIYTKLSRIDCDFLFFKDIDPRFDYYAPVIIGNADYLRENGEIARKFLKAVCRGYSYSEENPEASAKILLRQVPELNERFVVESQKWMSPRYIDDAASWGKIDPERWQNFYDFLYNEKIIDKRISNEISFTNEFLPCD